MDSIDLLNECSLDCWHSPWYAQKTQQPSFHEAIFSSDHRAEGFSKIASYDTERSSLEEQVEAVFMDSFDKLMTTGDRVTGEGQIQAGLQWGGPDGVTGEVGALGKAKDKNGRQITGEIKQSSTGKGSATVAAGYDPKDKEQQSKKSSEKAHSDHNKGNSHSQKTSDHKNKSEGSSKNKKK